MAYIKKSRFSRRKSIPRRKAAPKTKSIVKLIKNTIMRTAESKEDRSGLVLAPLLHNLPQIITTNLLSTPTAANSLLPYRNPREGDQIQCTGISFRFLFMTYADRPNVTFKVWVIKAPPYSPVSGVSPYTYDGWFINRTGQWVLDEINNTQVSVVKSMTFKPPVADSSQESGASLHETSYARKMYVPWKKVVTYQEQGIAGSGLTNESKGYSLQFMAAAYDTFGTLITDYVGKMLIQHSLHFKDF